MKTQQKRQYLMAFIWLSLSLTILAAINANAQKTTYLIEIGKGQEFQAAFQDDTLNAQMFYESFKVSVYKDESPIKLVIAQEECRAWFDLPYVKSEKKINLLLDNGQLVYYLAGKPVYRRDIRITYTY